MGKYPNEGLDKELHQVRQFKSQYMSYMLQTEKNINHNINHKKKANGTMQSEQGVRVVHSQKKKV